MRIGYRFNYSYEENYWAVIVVKPTGCEHLLIEKCSTKLIAHQLSFALNAQACIAEELGYRFFILSGDDGIRSWKCEVQHEPVLRFPQSTRRDRRIIGTYPTFPEAMEAIENHLGRKIRP